MKSKLFIVGLLLATLLRPLFTWTSELLPWAQSGIRPITIPLLPQLTLGFVAGLVVMPLIVLLADRKALRILCGGLVDAVFGCAVLALSLWRNHLSFQFLLGGGPLIALEWFVLGATLGWAAPPLAEALGPRAAGKTAV